MRDPERPDLSALDLGQNGERWERMVTNIMFLAAGELYRRRAAVRVPTPLESLVSFMRPALATAAVLAVLSLLALTRGGSDAYHPRMFFESGALPVPVTMWLEDGEAPTASDILLTNGEL